MKRWKRWTLVAVGGLVGLLALAYAVGAMLPVGHTATASRVVEGTREEVWTLMTDVDGLASWRPGLGTEDGEVYSPVFRFVSRFVMGHDATMNAYLDGLEARMAAGGGA